MKKYNMNSTIYLNEDYSTTKLVTQQKTKIINNPNDKFQSVLLLPEGKERKGEGGLRTQGYFKESFENKPLISIITVVYNGEKYLEETILSVINQSYDNIEYIVIDGGSTDGTLNIIKKYEDRIDYWVSENDSGIYDAMNKGITLCSGNIIGMVNADDLLYLETLEKISKVFDTISMFTCANLEIVDQEGKILETVSSLGLKSMKYKLFKHMPFLHPTMFVRIEVYKQMGLFDTKYRLSADYDFTLRLMSHHVKFKRLNFSTGMFRLGGESGGAESYLENHKLLLHHNVNPIFVYINTIVLFIKLFFRRVVNLWFQ